MHSDSIKGLLLVCAAVSAALPGQTPAAAGDARAPIRCDRDGTLRVEGARHRATFTPAGASLSTPQDGDRSDESTLLLRLLGLRRGDAFVAASDRPQPIASVAAVRYDHASTVERYELRANGFEQTFEFATAPAGEGDLVLSIEVGGNVTADATPAGHRTLTFFRDGHPVIDYGEAFAFDRAGQRVPVETSYDGLGRIELTVAAAFLDSARYPIVVDPVVSPIFNPSGLSTNDTLPDVAYDRHTDRYVVVWQRNASFFDRQIHARIYSSTGSVLTPVIPVTTGGDNQFASVAASNGSVPGFMVVWQGNDRIWGRQYDLGGNPLSNAFPLSLPGPGVRDRRPCISGPGDGAMMVAWDRTPQGANDPTSIMIRDVYWQLPGASGSVTMGGERALHSVTAGYVQNVKLARSDVTVTVGGQSWYANRAVWERYYTATSDFDVVTAAFRFRHPSGFQPIGNLTSIGLIGPDERFPDIAALASQRQDPNDLQYCVVWQDDLDISALLFDLNGSISAPITVRASAAAEVKPVVGAGHCEFTVTYGEVTGSGNQAIDLYAARILPFGSVPLDRRVVRNPGNLLQTGVRVSSRPILPSAGQQPNSSMIVWHDVTGTPVPTDASVRACRFEPVAPTLNYVGVGCPGPLGELPEIGWFPSQPYGGNTSFGIALDLAPVNSLAVLVFGTQLTNQQIPGAPGCFLLTGPPFLGLVPTVTDAVGEASVSMPIPCALPPNFLLGLQWGVYSPTANAFGWIVSNNLDISWQQ